MLSVGLRAHEDAWFAPFADLVLRRAPGESPRSRRRRPASLFPPLGPVHRVLHAPGSARVDGRGMAAALRAGRGGARRHLRRRVRCTASWRETRAGSGRAPRRRRRRGGPQQRRLPARSPWPAAPGRRRWGSGSARALPVGPTKGQIVHLGVEAETGGWPIAQPLLTHYLVPWPGGRVACGGTFEAGAGFSVSVTAAGLHELLARVPDRRAGTGGRHLPRDPGRAAARPRPTTAPSWAACRAGATRGWPRATAPTACCRVRTRPGCWRTPWRASPLPADEAPLPGSFDPGRFG